jgi:hypothetical protein
MRRALSSLLIGLFGGVAHAGAPASTEPDQLTKKVIERIENPTMRERAKNTVERGQRDRTLEQSSRKTGTTHRSDLLLSGSGVTRQSTVDRPGTSTVRKRSYGPYLRSQENVVRGSDQESHGSVSSQGLGQYKARRISSRALRSSKALMAEMPKLLGIDQTLVDTFIDRQQLFLVRVAERDKDFHHNATRQVTYKLQVNDRELPITEATYKQVLAKANGQP